MKTYSWPQDRLSEALEALARRYGLDAKGPGQKRAAHSNAEIETAARALGLEAESVESSYAEVEKMIRCAGPAVLRLHFDGEVRYLLLCKANRSHVKVLAPDLTLRRLQLKALGTALCSDLEAPLKQSIGSLLKTADVPERARRALLLEQLRGSTVGGCWMLRLPPSANFWHQIRRAGLPRLLAGMLTLHALQHFIWILSWWALGSGILKGRFDAGLLLTWALLMLTALPPRLLCTWLQARLTYGASALLKQRLLLGAMKLDDTEMRHQGSGLMLGRVIESETVQQLLLSGGMTTLLALVEAGFALAVLALGPAGGWSVSLFLAWFLLVIGITGLYYRKRRRWTDSRMSMTHDMVEKLVGHRTRVVQERPEQRHKDEDRILDQYISESVGMDRLTALLLSPVARSWMLASLALLAPGLVAGGASPGLLALGLGGILLGAQSLGQIHGGLGNLVGAAIAWEQVRDLFRAASQTEPLGKASVGRTSGNVVEALDLRFGYPDRHSPVLTGCGLRIRPGDRILLEGASGSGKTTLCKLLTGLHKPDAGLLLLRGMDRETLGFDAWRQRVATAPQFHENHILTGSLAFNLLMGLRWPPRSEDLIEAESICRDLGLGELLDQMPGGLMQTVGETGWQLSHGEKSRVFIARALLQQADLVIFDESFAALDPETLGRCFRSVVERSHTLLVVAHA